jgi:hypothetical protein
VKATFSVTLIVLAHHTAISNMPESSCAHIAGGKKKASILLHFDCIDVNCLLLIFFFLLLYYYYTLNVLIDVFRSLFEFCLLVSNTNKSCFH